MKTLEKAQDKIKKIADELRREAIEPAHAEAKEIIEKAKMRAAEIISEAENQAAKYIEESTRRIEQERNVFHSSLQQAAKQSIETLKQAVETQFFNDQLDKLLKGKAADPAIVARLIDAVVTAIKAEGLSANLVAIIPKTVSADEVARLLVNDVLNSLKSHPIELGGFSGGVKVKLVDKNMMVDISEEALKELLVRFVRKDFRKLLYQT